MVVVAAAGAAHHIHQQQQPGKKERTNTADSSNDYLATVTEGPPMSKKERVLRVIVDFTIVVNIIQMGVCAQDPSGDVGDFCTVTEHCFTVIFLLELLLLMVWLGWKKYFEVENFLDPESEEYKRFGAIDKARWLDAFLVLAAITDSWIARPIMDRKQDGDGGDLLKLLSLLRILRIIRLLRSKKEMRMILEGLAASLLSMTWVALLLGVLIYVAAIVSVIFFSDVNTAGDLDFTSLGNALLTLFSIAIVADWSSIVVPTIASYPWSAAFFIAFIVLASFGVLNLIIGVIAERTIDVQKHYDEEERKDQEHLHMKRVDEIAHIIFADQDDATLTKEEMQGIVEGEEHGEHLKDLTGEIKLPAGMDIFDCHAMFDRDASGTIEKREFVQGMKRLIFSDNFQRSCMVEISISDVMTEVKQLEGKMLAQMGFIKEELRALRRGKGRLPHQGDSGADDVEFEPAAKEQPAFVLNTQLPQEEVPDSPSYAILVQRLREPLIELLGSSMDSNVESLAAALEEAGNLSVPPHGAAEGAQQPGVAAATPMTMFPPETQVMASRGRIGQKAPGGASKAAAPSMDARGIAGASAVPGPVSGPAVPDVVTAARV